jgi:hypothetical protein
MKNANQGVYPAWSDRAMPRRSRKNPRQLHCWEPSEGEHYSLILGNGMIERFPWNDTHFDHEAWHVGNCFQTHEEAVQAREKIKAVLRIMHQDHASACIASP